MPAPLGSLKDQTIDVLVLGGGLLGTSTARALAARGARVALVEPIDFGWGASGRTSRLALEEPAAKVLLRPGRFRALLRERATLVHAARPAALPVPVVVPRALVGAGEARSSARRERLASWLAPGGWPGPRAAAGKAAGKIPLAALEEGKARLHFDALVDDRRLVLLTALAAAKAGVVLAQRCDLTGLEVAEGGGVWAEIRDRVTGEAVNVRARAVVNATGAWIDHVRASLDVGREKLFPLARAVRVAIDDPSDAAALLGRRDGAPFLLAPATRGTLLAAPFEPAAQGSRERAAERLLRLAADYFGARPEPRAAFEELRPAVERAAMAREAARGAPFWSVAAAGALRERLTARRLAERIEDELGRFAGRGARAPLAASAAGASLKRERQEARGAGLGADQARWMVGRYGAAWREVVTEAGGAEPLADGAPPLRCEVAWAVREEGARTLSDILLRWRLPEIAPSLEIEEIVAAAAADDATRAFAWSPVQRERELERWRHERRLAYGPAEIG